MRKGAYRYVLRDANQLAAFLNAGWEIVEETKNPKPAEKEPDPFAYTKTEINRMKADTVIEIAKQDGIDVTDKSATELKKILIVKHNL